MNTKLDKHDNPVINELAKLTGNPDYPLLIEARTYGVIEPLARYIEEGGEICGETRGWIAAYLRGEIPKRKPGVKRSKAQRDADFNLWVAVAKIMQQKKVSEFAALNSYLNENPGENLETCRTALKRIKSEYSIFETQFLVSIIENGHRDS